MMNKVTLRIVSILGHSLCVLPQWWVVFIPSHWWLVFRNVCNVLMKMCDVSNWAQELMNSCRTICSYEMETHETHLHSFIH